MSADLQWALLRNFNSFMVKRSGIQFSTESGNLMNKHSFKDSGLVQNRVVRIEGFNNGGVVLSHRLTRPGNQVAKSFSKQLVISSSAGIRGAVKKVVSNLESIHYRRDLMTAVKARVSALMESKLPRKQVSKKYRANKLAKLTKNN